MFRMRDEKGADDKVLCGRLDRPAMAPLKDITDVTDFDKLEILHFFECNKALEPNKEVEIGSWVGLAQAEAEIEACRKRLADTAAD